MEEKLVTKDDLLNKLRAYSDTPDDEGIQYKKKIEKAFMQTPALLYARTLSFQVVDTNGIVNTVNGKTMINNFQLRR